MVSNKSKVTDFLNTEKFAESIETQYDINKLINYLLIFKPINIEIIREF
jgi:hypothetical protein